MKNKYFTVIGLIVIFILSFSVLTFAYGEAPMLKQKVEKGNLPSIEKRLPEDPMIIEPLDKIGKYGGTWNRVATAEQWSHLVMAMDGAKLFRFSDKDLQPHPNLVQDWETNKDKSSWIFHFRKGVKWSDGVSVTVDDFIFWWKDMVLNDQHSMSPLAWTKINGKLMKVSKIDDYTVRLEFAGSNPFLLQYLSMWSSWSNTGIQVFPKHYLKQFHPDYNDQYKNFQVFEEKQDWWVNPEIPVLNAWRPVELKSGESLVLERNPYYFAVDPEGNQLPYIDRIKVSYVADNEVYKLKLMSGESDMQIRPGPLTLRDISSLKQNEEKYNFKTLVWSSGSGTGPIFMPNRNYPDPTKRKLYKNSKFLKALSHAIDRDKINKVIYYGTGYNTTGTYSSKTPFFTTENGKKLYEEWKDSAVEYDIEKSKKFLDELGVTDQDGDGWRDLPNGKKLTLRIDIDAAANPEYIDTSEIVKQNWSAIGLKTLVNTVDGSQLTIMRTNANFDIMGGWEASDGSSIIGQPGWIAPVDPDHHWAPLYDNWYLAQGTSKEGTELDKDPRDRQPPRKKPEPGSPMAKLIEYYDQAKRLPTREERAPLVSKMIQIHIDHGPFFIGTVAGWPRVGVVKNYFKNVPDKLNAGWVQDWHLSYIASLNPEQFYIDK